MKARQEAAKRPGVPCTSKTSLSLCQRKGYVLVHDIDHSVVCAPLEGYFLFFYQTCLIVIENPCKRRRKTDEIGVSVSAGFAAAHGQASRIAMDTWVDTSPIASQSSPNMNAPPPPAIGSPATNDIFQGSRINGDCGRVQCPQTINWVDLVAPNAIPPVAVNSDVV